MVLSLERARLIRREPSRARTIQAARAISVLVDPMTLPQLQPSHHQTVKTTVTTY
jgi:hypothetical protein